MNILSFGKKQDPLRLLMEMNEEHGTSSDALKNRLKTVFSLEREERILARKLQRLSKKEKTRSKDIEKTLEKIMELISSENAILIRRGADELDKVVNSIKREHSISEKMKKTGMAFIKWNSAVAAELETANKNLGKSYTLLINARKRADSMKIDATKMLNKEETILKNKSDLIKLCRKRIQEIAPKQNDITRILKLRSKISELEKANYTKIRATVALAPKLTEPIQKERVLRVISDAIINEKQIQEIEGSMLELIKELRSLVDLGYLESKS